MVLFDMDGLLPDIKTPSAETVALGYIIVPDLLEGARLVGLI